MILWVELMWALVRMTGQESSVQSIWQMRWGHFLPEPGRSKKRELQWHGNLHITLVCMLNTFFVSYAFVIEGFLNQLDFTFKPIVLTPRSFHLITQKLSPHNTNITNQWVNNETWCNDVYSLASLSPSSFFSSGLCNSLQKMININRRKKCMGECMDGQKGYDTLLTHYKII